MMRNLNTIVEELVKNEKVVRINPLWVAVNEAQFGHSRVKVLKALDNLGYKKKHVMLYDEAGNKNTLICYVQDGFVPSDKPLIGKAFSASDINERFALDFLHDVKEAYLDGQLPAHVKIDPPFFEVSYVEGHLVAFFTREVLRKLVTALWLEKGKCTHEGVNLIVRTVEQLSEQTYMRKNTYRKNENGETRARIEDKLIYRFTY